MKAEAPRTLPKRFYKQAQAEPVEGGYRIALDGKPVHTPRAAPLVIPSAALAQAIAAEWQAQGERLDPETMPLTRMANSGLDLVRGREEAVIDEIVSYAASDLLCYRAEGPEGLIALQREHWDPVLAWAAQELGTPFHLAEGVMHVAQPEASLAALRDTFAGFSPLALAALHNLTTLSGSALLALAHARGQMSAEQAWRAAHVDEDWQVSQWGADAEATARRERRWRDFDAASRLLALL